MVTYCIIGFMLFVWCLFTVSEGRKIDLADVTLSLVFFFIIWPIGVILFIGIFLCEILNKKHKR